jgi:hypothetical protein
MSQHRHRRRSSSQSWLRYLPFGNPRLSGQLLPFAADNQYASLQADLQAEVAERNTHPPSGQTQTAVFEGSSPSLGTKFLQSLAIPEFKEDQ